MEKAAEILARIQARAKPSTIPLIPSDLDEASESPSTDCKLCNGQEWVYKNVRIGHPDYGKLFRCVCMKEQDDKEQQERYFKMCSLPPGTEDWTFENFKKRAGTEGAYQAALALAQGAEDIHWLTLVSGPDRGKSHLAIAICREWLKRGRSARYGLVPQLLDELRAGYDHEGERSFESKMAFMCKVALLVLDDLGVEKPSEWAMEKVQSIIDYRYTNGLPLVVTTNRPLDGTLFGPGHEMASRRVASRLQRAKGAKVVLIDAPEYRIWKGRKGG